RRHTRFSRDWSSDVCSSDLPSRIVATSNRTLRAWVDHAARLLRPDAVHWCTGSEGERRALIEQMVARGDLIELNQSTHPNCYLRSEERRVGKEWRSRWARSH